jgi:hypothetical protein
MTHTPGPWVVDDGRKLKRKKLRSELLMVVAEKGGMPGIIVNQGVVTATDEANARLIAAAPELLEAALVALDAITRGTPDDTGPVIDKLTAALKKAGSHV